MDNELVERLSKELNIQSSRIKEYLEYCTIVRYRKKEIILPQDHIFDSLGYLIDGCARTYYIDQKGNEVSYLLQLKGDVVGDYARFIGSESSNFHIQFLIDTEVLHIHKNNLQLLIEKDSFWLGFSKYISDAAFLSAKQRLDELFYFNPKERYLNLLRKSPEVIQQIPQKFIASYLGITIPSLSRIRKRIN